jgi:hypothetical protein
VILNHEPKKMCRAGVTVIRKAINLDHSKTKMSGFSKVKIELMTLGL